MIVRTCAVVLWLCASSVAAEPALDAIDIAERFAPLRPPTLSAEERSRLAAGEILVRELPPSDEDGLGVVSIGVVEATPEAVWRVMADCEHYA